MTTQPSTAITTEPPVWFITGCSTGFGLELARQAIEHGHRTVLTARHPAKLEGYGAKDKVLVLQLGVTQPAQVAAAVQAAEAPLRRHRRAGERRVAQALCRRRSCGAGS